MTPATLVCRSCSADVPLDGPEVTCPDCGETYTGLDGLGRTSGGGSGETEADLQREIVELLEMVGFHVSTLDQGYRPDGSTRQTAGLPDLWAMHPTQQVALWVEVKGPDTPVRESQRAWHGVAREADVHVTVARSREDVVDYLREIGMEIAA